MAEKQRLGELALARGFLTREELEDALRTQAELFRDGEDRSVGDVLVEKGYLRQSQLETLLKAQVEAGKKRIGHYELVARLGEGGMGAVYKARDDRTGEHVALKILPRRLAQDQNYVRRFEREGRLGLKLDHPNVVKTFEVGEAEGPGGTRYHFMAIEYVEGADLDKILEKRKRLPERKALEIALAVTRALHHAQLHHMVHRDIKPANILMSKDGRILLADLGLARSTSEDATRLTVTGAALGTPNYISPEQARGEKEVDSRTDIYSLGATFYRMLTGKAPFEGGTAAVVVAKHLTEELQNPQDIVPEVSDGAALLIERMMAKAREDRHADPAELIADIERVLSGKEPEMTLDLGFSSVRPPEALARVAPKAEARPVTKRPRPTRPRPAARARRRAPTVEARPVADAEKRRKLMMMVGAGTACVVLLAGTLFALFTGEEPQPRPRRRPRPALAPEKPAEEGDLPASPGAPAVAARPAARPSVSEPAPIAETEATAAAQAEGPYVIPPGFKKSILYREDYEAGAGTWTGDAMKHPTDGGYVLRSRASPEEEYHSYVAKAEHVELAAKLTTRVSLRHKISVGLSVSLLQFNLTNARGQVRNYKSDLRPAGRWSLVDFPLEDMKPNGPPIDREQGFEIRHLSVLSGAKGERGECYIDDIEIYDVVPIEHEDVAAKDADRKKREEEARRAAEEAEKRQQVTAAREREDVYRMFQEDIRALLAKRAYDQGLELAEAFPDKRAKEYASDARLLKGYSERALRNASRAIGKRVKVCGISGRLKNVADGGLTIDAGGAEFTQPFGRLKSDEVVALAEYDPPTERFGMRALFYYAEGDIARAEKEARGAKGGIADRVTWLLALVQAERRKAATPPPPESKRPEPVEPVARAPATGEIAVSDDFEGGLEIWTVVQQDPGVSVSVAGGQLKIEGETTKGEWGDVGLCSRAYRLESFEVTVRLKVLSFEGSVRTLIMFVADALSGSEVSAHSLYFIPWKSYGYTWHRGEKGMKTKRMRRFGDERTAFHTLRLSYDGKDVTACVDSKVIGSFPSNSRVWKFRVAAQSGAPETKYGCLYDDFSLKGTTWALEVPGLAKGLEPLCFWDFKGGLGGWTKFRAKVTDGGAAGEGNRAMEVVQRQGGAETRFDPFVHDPSPAGVFSWPREGGITFRYFVEGCTGIRLCFRNVDAAAYASALHLPGPEEGKWAEADLPFSNAASTGGALNKMAPGVVVNHMVLEAVIPDGRGRALFDDIVVYSGTVTAPTQPED